MILNACFLLTGPVREVAHITFDLVSVKWRMTDYFRAKVEESQAAFATDTANHEPKKEKFDQERFW